MDRQEKTSKQIILVTGAARSGKSEWAETLASETKKSVIYVATARIDPEDREWHRRIEKHRLRRPSHWQTLTIPVDLGQTIETSRSSDCLLIDSLGTWVANLLEYDEQRWEKTAKELTIGLKKTAADVILVAEETGWGVVPAYPTGRVFRDRLGMLIRQIGAIGDRVYLVAGGHVLDLSILGKPLRNSKFSTFNSETNDPGD